MAKILRSLAAMTAFALLGLSIIGGIIVWLWALLLWNSLYGLLGLLIGVLTISDLALPFVWRHQTGEWPLAWIIAILTVVALRILGAITGALSENRQAGLREVAALNLPHLIAEACQRGSCRPGRASPSARAGNTAVRCEPTTCSPAVPCPCLPSATSPVHHGQPRTLLTS